VLPYLDDAEAPAIFPTPQEIETLGTRIRAASTDDGHVPCLSTAHADDGAIAEAWRVFRQTMTLLAGETVPADDVRTIARNPDVACAVVIDLQLSPGFGPESYAIEPDTAASPPWVRLTGGSRRALYYAVASLAQLAEPDADAPGTVWLRAARVYDRPAYRVRAISGWGQGSDDLVREVEFARWAPSVKLNAMYLNYPSLGEPWWEPDETYRHAVETIGRERRADGLVDLGVLVNPYAERIRDKDAVFDTSDPAHVARVTDLVERTVGAGANRVMLCVDDFVPSAGPSRHDYALATDDEKAQFGSLAAAHAALIGAVRDAVARADGAASVSFVPPWYGNVFWDAAPERADAYFAELRGAVPTRIPWVWTGPAIRSLRIDLLPTERFRRAAGHDRPLLIWDNTLYARRHRHYWGPSASRAHRASWLQPFDVAIYEGAWNDVEGFYLNGQAHELYRIKYMTAADYLWNPEAYDPERSLARVLVTLYGRTFAEKLLEWDERFWALRERVNGVGVGEDDAAARLVLQSEIGSLGADLLALEKIEGADPRLTAELQAELVELFGEVMPDGDPKDVIPRFEPRAEAFLTPAVARP